MNCQVKFYFYTPTFKNNSPSMNKMTLISFGEHSHPPPPPRKISEQVKKRFSKIFIQFGLADVTARQLIASSLLPILLEFSSHCSYEFGCN